MSVNLNDTKKYNTDEISIFNNGEAGVATGVAISVEKKGPKDKENSPDYKFYATDDNGKVNEGFYYQEDDSKAFNVFQSQKLIWLGRGIMGDDFKFPEFKSAKDALDQVMKLVATNTQSKLFDVVVAYGPKKKPSRFLSFKEFGRFIKKTGEDIELKLSDYDSLERGKSIDDSSDEDSINDALDTDPKEDWINN